MRKKVSIKGDFSIYTSNNKEKLLDYFSDDEFHTYLINGSLVLKENAVTSNKIFENFIVEPLPKPEKEKIPNDLNLIKVEGYTNKAATISEKQIIFLNKDFFKKLNVFERMFVIGHELGHRFYYNEHFCDLFALHFCLSNFIDLRFINFDKILNSPKRKKIIFNYFKIERI